MESVGEYLKRERTLRGVSLQRIHEATRVPLKTLEAIERDDYEGLPHPAFVKGFIKTYCKELGLDETDAVLRYELHLREALEAPKQPPKPEKTAFLREAGPRPALNPRKAAVVLVGGGVLLIFAFYAVSVFTGREAPRKAAEGEPPAKSQEVTNAGDPHPVSEVWKGSPGSKLQEGTAPSSTGTNESALAPEEARKAAVPVAPAAPGRHTLTVHAAENTWVEVSIDGGKPFDVLLKSGERVTWEAGDTISIVLGNAGGVEVLFDGQAVPLSGKSGEVKRLKFPS